MFSESGSTLDNILFLEMQKQLRYARRMAWLSAFQYICQLSFIKLARRVKLDSSRNRDDITRRGTESLNQILLYAQSRVPFYKNRSLFQVTSPPPPLEQFPVLHRIDLKNSFDQLIARENSGLIENSSDLYIAQTSGSTGSPASHLKSRSAELYSQCVFLSRLFRTLKLPSYGNLFDFGLRRKQDPIVEIRLLPGAYISWNFRRFRANCNQCLREYRSLVSIAKPTVIYGMPSRIRDFIKYCETLSIKLHPKIVICSFEQLDPSDRKFFEDFFECPVQTVYGTTELGMCAWECEAGRLHFDDDIALPEVLQIDDNPCAGGELGRLIITSLQAKVMPLIRYDTGDIALMNTAHCPCGSTSKNIERIEGRSTSAIVARNGTRVSEYQIIRLASCLSISDYQIIQDCPGVLRLIVPTNAQIHPDNLIAFNSRVSNFLRESTDVSVEFTGNFVLTPSGKRNPVVQHLK